MFRALLTITGGLIRWTFFESFFRFMIGTSVTLVAAMYLYQEPIREFLRIGTGI